MSLGQFDATPVFSTSAARTSVDSIDQDLIGYLTKNFREFIRNFRLSSLNYIYRDKLTSNLNMNIHSLEIDINHINQFDNKMFLLLSDNPTKVLSIFEKCISEYVQEISIIGNENLKKTPKHFQIVLLVNTNSLSIRDLNSKLLDKLIKVEGIVVSLSSLRSKVVSMAIQCKGCKNIISDIHIPNAIETYPLPKKCPTDQIGKEACPYDPFVILPDKSTCIDSQICIIQESPQSVPQGEMPRHLQIYLDRSLCDKVVPGNYILVSGIYCIKNSVSKDKSTGGGVGIRAPYVKATGIEILKDGVSQSVVSSLKPHEEILFKQLANRKDIYDVLTNSIAPSIYGNEDVKKSLLCLLFGGSRKQMPDSLLRRGDINILLLGDPGTAKSQLLKFIEKCSPIGVYTSGKGSSAAGLTASVIKDGNSKGFIIEGGAMVLADGGVVCIDEFDKMRDEDRVTIHEAMEQQTISIAKAGITSTLNTRCSVLAAANSVFGRWDDTKGEKNIDLMPTILSRFDMIYIIKDVFNDKRDNLLARHVIDIHSSDQIDRKPTDNFSKKEVLTPENVNTIKELDIGTLRRYISYCRLNCGPRLSYHTAEKLKKKYITMRNGSLSLSNDTNKQNSTNVKQSNKKSTIPITVRQLEALIRISESLAKMRLASFTSDEDVNEAMRLFHVSTLSAAKSGKIVGVEGVTTYSDQSMLNDIEKQLRKRFIPGSQVAVRSIITDFSNQNYPEILVQRVIDSMVYRGNAQYNSDRSLIIRVK